MEPVVTVTVELVVAVFADTAAVSYGYLDPDEDCAAWGADYQVAHPLELLDIVFAN